MNNQRSICLLLVAASLAIAGADEPFVPPDQCALELNLPPGATVSVDGKNKGLERTITFRSLNPKLTYKSQLEVRFRSGQRTQRSVLVLGGQRVQISLADPIAIRPRLALQTGNTGDVHSIAFSNDGRYIATGAGERPAVIKLWSIDGRELRTFEGHLFAITDLAFSADGKRLASASNDHTMRLWDLSTGKQVRVWRHGDSLNCLAFSSDGRLLASGSGGYSRSSEKRIASVRVFDTESGAERWSSTNYSDLVEAVTFSPDSTRLLSAAWDARGVEGADPQEQPVRLWDAASGRELARYRAPAKKMYSIAFSADGAHPVAGAWDQVIGVWDLATNKQSQVAIHPFTANNLKALGDSQPALFSGNGVRLMWFTKDNRVGIKQFHEKEWTLRTSPIDEAPEDSYRCLTLSPDGHQLALATDEHVLIWDVDQSKELIRLQGQAVTPDNVTISPGGKWLVCENQGPNLITSGHDHNLYLWDLSTGRLVRAIKAHEKRIAKITFSPDEQWFATASFDKTFRLWDVQSGQEFRRFDVEAMRVTDIAFSPDGRSLVAGIFGKDLPLWDTDTKQQLRLFKGAEPAGALSSVAMSADGRRVAGGRWWGPIQIWDVASGQEVRCWDAPGQNHSLAFSPDGSKVLSTGSGLYVWDANTGRKLRSLVNDNERVNAAAFSPDGRMVAASNVGGIIDLTTFRTVRSTLYDGKETAWLWDAETGRLLHRFYGHREGAESVAFSRSGKTLITSNPQEGIRLWDVATGSALGRIVLLKCGESLVVTTEGLFDGPEQARKLVSFQIAESLDLVPVDRFFQDFYYPGLLAALLRGERPLPGAQLKHELPPRLQIVSPQLPSVQDTPQITLTVEAEDQGGGIQGPWLLHNGARVLASKSAERLGKTLRREFAIALVEGDNRLEFRAASRDGSWESEPVAMVVHYARPVNKPRLFVVAVGIDDYASEAMKLQFAKRDALDLAELFRQRGRALYDDVLVWPLTDEKATREGIRRALDEVRGKARPQDTLVLFLAGHGATVGQRYYFLPHDFRKAVGASVDDDVRRYGLPEDVLGDYISGVSATKRVLIYDTCQSGAALGTARSRSGHDLRRAIERLSHNHGVFAIAAAGTSEEAKEVPELEHGVLTYALLGGLRAVKNGPLAAPDKAIKPSSDDGVADVFEWFSFAAAQVPQLTEHYLHYRQEVEHKSEGRSFPLLPVSAN